MKLRNKYFFLLVFCLFFTFQKLIAVDLSFSNEVLLKSVGLVSKKEALDLSEKIEESFEKLCPLFKMGSLSLSIPLIDSSFFDLQRSSSSSLTDQSDFFEQAPELESVFLNFLTHYKLNLTNILKILNISDHFSDHFYIKTILKIDYQRPGASFIVGGKWHQDRFHEDDELDNFADFVLITRLHEHSDWDDYTLYLARQKKESQEETDDLSRGRLSPFELLAAKKKAEPEIDLESISCCLRARESIFFDNKKLLHKVAQKEELRLSSHLRPRIQVITTIFRK